MKKPIPNPPVFDPLSRTLDFSSTPNFDVRRLLGVAHIKTAQFIYSPIVPELALVDATGSVVTLSFNTTGMQPSDKLLIEYDDGINDLPPDAATNTKLEQLRTFLATAGKQDEAKAVLGSILTALGPLGTDATLQAILSAIRAQRSETIWTDDTGTRFIRIDSGGTVSWTTVAGDASSPPGAGARPDSDSGTVVSRSTYRATASGAGFAAGDFLDHLVVTDGDAGDLVSNFWIDVTSGAKIAAPGAASITPLAPLPDGASTAAKQDTGNAALASLLTGIGAPADADPGSDGAAGSVIARLARLLATATGISTILTAVRDRLPAALVGGRLSVDGSAVTQPVSASALPLPSGASTSALQGTGNATLSNLSTALGGPSDTDPGSDAAPGSAIALLRRGLGNWTTLLSRVPALVAGRFPVDGSGVTQPVSAAALPLPAGASNAANQALEIAQLTAANQRTALFADFTNQNVAAGATLTGPWHDAGASPSPYTKFNYAFVANQTGTAVVQVSNDGVNVLTNFVTDGSLGPTKNIIGTVPLTYRYYRLLLLNGSTAAIVGVNSSLSTN